jgi:hypothetical protein
MSKIRYWYHPESDSLWTSNVDEIARGDGLVEELSKEEYEAIQDKQELKPKKHR